MAIAVNISVRYWIKEDPISILKEAGVENPENETAQKLEKMFSELTIHSIEAAPLIRTSSIDIIVGPTPKEEEKKENDRTEKNLQVENGPSTENSGS